ncbi:protein kintoun [Sitodiplosis mosellana]|uniref:protein kintoun n=1 Tax=Sitodiplosis mosellana TaxID=263140 RepID=UPI002444A532|nr:protein kintoun [Sitodiplosis mosellana]
MSKTETEWRNFDLTTDELDRFTKAFKSEKFRSLFVEYCKEINDPENRRIYEAELKQLEAERGIDIKFINPEPGFVVKSIANGNQKIFINVAKSDAIEKPTSQCGFDAKTGEKGLNWSLPYVQSKPKHDFDKNKVICAVFDVIFHSDTLHLAQKNPAFKKLVIETAYDAVRSAFDLTLDSITNLKFPKLAYKGQPTPVVIRKKCTEQSINAYGNAFGGGVGKQQNGEHRNGDDEVPKRKEAKPMANNAAIDEYETPKYELIHRRHIEMHEFTDELDAKLNITVPKELVIKIQLPLLNSSKDVVLDVNTKSIHMHCDTPAKYKLNVSLPHEVDKEMGTAQFDNQTKILAITLPVLSRKQMGIFDLCREDSGVESDHHSPKEDSSLGLDDDVFTDDCDHYSNQMSTEIEEVGSVQQTNEKDSFLESSINYTLPHFTYNRFENVVAFTLHVKNVESTSIVAIDTSNSYRLKFSTVGSGYFNNYYAFYFAMPTGTATISESPRVETWDNNVVIQIELDSIDRFASYDVGLSANDCKHFACNEKKSYNDVSEKVAEDKTNYVEVGTAMSNEELQIEITNKNFKAKSTTDDDEDEIKAPAVQRPKTKKSKRDNSKKARSYSESHCDELKQTEEAKQVNGGENHANDKKPCPQHAIKSRTQSESSNDEHHMDLFPLKGILKRHSSYDRTTTPECSLDEHGCAGSIDLGIGSFKSIPEEKDAEHSESVKKTVRFDKQLCRKLLFKMNSTIIGQRKPKENKRKKKKRNQERRYSEGEASDYENNLQPSGACCQKPTASVDVNKNNKDTEHKTNLIFDIEI